MLRPYEVLVTSNRTALIEMVPDAPSIHHIKSKSPAGNSLATHFFTKFGQVSSPALSLSFSFHVRLHCITAMGTSDCCCSI